MFVELCSATTIFCYVVKVEGALTQVIVSCLLYVHDPLTFISSRTLAVLESITIGNVPNRFFGIHPCFQGMLVVGVFELVFTGFF